MTKQPRPRVLAGKTYLETCGCGDVFVFCNDHHGQLFEVFIKLGKSGGCGSATMEGVGKVMSVALRSGADPLDMVKALKGIECHKSAPKRPSCLTAIAWIVGDHIEAKGGDLEIEPVTESFQLDPEEVMA